MFNKKLLDTTLYTRQNGIDGLEIPRTIVIRTIPNDFVVTDGSQESAVFTYKLIQNLAIVGVKNFYIVSGCRQSSLNLINSLTANGRITACREGLNFSIETLPEVEAPVISINDTAEYEICEMRHPCLSLNAELKARLGKMMIKRNIVIDINTKVFFSTTSLSKEIKTIGAIIEKYQVETESSDPSSWPLKLEDTGTKSSQMLNYSSIFGYNKMQGLKTSTDATLIPQDVRGSIDHIQQNILRDMVIHYLCFPSKYKGTKKMYSALALMRNMRNEAIKKVGYNV